MPRGLACLTRYYAATAVAEKDGWDLVVDGKRIPWDDRRAKTFAERLDHPDGKDMFVAPYVAGPIRPVTRDDEDPGRVRLEPLFVATYPAASLVRVAFFGHRVRVQRAVAPALARVAARLAGLARSDPSLLRFVARLGGTYNPRRIAGTTRTSAHAWGIALDLDPSLTDYWRWPHRGPTRRPPQAIVDAFEAEGFLWGGRWYHYDTMHFEYRPELLDGKCREEAALRRQSSGSSSSSL